MKESEPRRWREWGPTYFASVVTIAGFVVGIAAAGRMLRATIILNASVRQLTVLQEEAARRLEHQTGTLVTWTKVLVGVTVLLFVVTVALLLVTVWPSR